jgi:spermidine synthase
MASTGSRVSTLQPDSQKPDSAPSPAERGKAGSLRRLFLISFLILFAELACIRWFGSTVVFLTFFTNLVLMACFLGMSVGCLAASRRQDLVNTVIPLLLAASAAACLTLVGYMRISRLTIDVGRQQQPQQVFFGTEARPADPGRFVVPIEAVAGVFFVLVALVFVGLGQEMGRSFNAIPDRVAAYTTNVLGSLAGIAAFGLASYLRSPPLVWFAVVGALVLPFVTHRRPLHAALMGISLLVFAFGSYRTEVVAYFDPPVAEPGVPVGSGSPQTIWSPYYKIEYTPLFRSIYTNNIGHQAMQPIPDQGQAYLLPYLLSRDAGSKPFQDVLIIGAGSGNDVRAAVVNGARRVDAVEIDRVLTELGREHHPDRPYASPQVVSHFDDGRDFVHNTVRKFDLVNYALVDSLVLHSGYSSLRLESFLFTEEALRDIKAKLKPGGVFAMYNYYRRGWVVGRLVKLVEKVFGTRPLVMTVPYAEEVKPDDAQREAITFLLVGNDDSSPVEAIRREFEAKHRFWSYKNTAVSLRVNGFGPEPPADRGEDKVSRIGLARVDTTGIDRLPSDDWPFLYLRDPVIPALNLRGMALVAVLSLTVLAAFAPVRTARLSGRMFFLGAGFMLLETKGVVHMALLFGSTWVVNSFVFFAILVMILLSNLYVLAAKPRRLGAYYALLAAALALNAAVPMATFLGLPGAARVVVSCAVVFVPVFFAGVIFAASFRDSTRPDVDFGSNIGGVILGGLSENLSMMFGFNDLILLAIAYYALSAVLGSRRGAGMVDLGGMR